MSHKDYGKKHAPVKKFYFSPSSHYCAIVAKDKQTIDEIRHKVLDHYIRDPSACHQKQFIPPGRGNGAAGQLIHVTKNIADKLMGETSYEGIDIEICIIDFDNHNEKKSGLLRLINRNS